MSIVFYMYMYMSNLFHSKHFLFLLLFFFVCLFFLIFSSQLVSKCISPFVSVSFLLILAMVIICVKCREHYRTRNTASYMTEVPHSLVAANDQDITVFELNEYIAEARVKPSIKVE